MQRSLKALGAALAVFLKKTSLMKKTGSGFVHLRIMLRSNYFNKQQKNCFHWIFYQMLVGKKKQSCTSLLQHAWQQHIAQQCPKPVAFAFKWILVLGQGNRREEAIPSTLTSRMAPSQTLITLRNVGMTWGRNCTHFSPRDLKIKVMAWTTIVWCWDKDWSRKILISATMETAG